MTVDDDLKQSADITKFLVVCKQLMNEQDTTGE